MYNKLVGSCSTLTLMSICVSFACKKWLQQELLTIFKLLTNPTIHVALRSRSAYCTPSPSMLMQNRCRSVANHRSWCKFLECIDHPWWWRLHESFFDFTLEQFSCWFTVPFASTKLPLLFLISSLIGSLLRKLLPSAVPFADWFYHCDVTRHGFASDAHDARTQTSQNIHVSS